MPNITVLCGQDLSLSKALWRYDCHGEEMYAFPEKQSGPEGLRKLVRDTIEKKVDTIFITRFGIILNTLGVCIEKGTLHPLDVEVHLYTEDCWSCHYFNSQGFLNDTWPFGILD